MRGIAILLVLLLVPSSASYVYAHTTVDVEQYSIEIGWGIEPPVVSYRNTIVFAVLEKSQSQGVTSGVKNAFQDAEAVIKIGGATKQLDINSDPRPGHYFADIIPTKAGAYTVQVTGTINGVPVSIDVKVEDVESTAILDFPQQSSSSSSSSDLVGPIKDALDAMQRDIMDMKENKMSDNTMNEKGGVAYDFAVFGMSLGVAGVVLSVVAILKRRNT